ncbi:TPA: hypothetical protein N0F65_005189 [Lagenidium giganteum]|uniref:Temptin Cys/Cys disulfide domain-containing protein n=1 Tax=Lagenidium giganteum TaxID=4803 RepID=A0AAV2Z1Q1_9STRA|nr:TPA: hypothetical protein N0F65_005189 [Lagenidium giganteum]
MKIAWVVAAFASMALQVAAHDTYVKLIPNGGNVDGVQAVGHVNPNGDGARNKFGKAFGDADETWTTTLCQADSDGDGQTNGEELGDPCCVWKQGKDSLLQRTTGLSNPGDPKSKSDETASGFKCQASNSTNGVNGTNATLAPGINGTKNNTTTAPETNSTTTPAPAKSGAVSYHYIVAAVFGLMGAVAMHAM